MRIMRLLSSFVFVLILSATTSLARTPGKGVDPSKGIKPGSITNEKLANGEITIAKVCVVPAEGTWSRKTLKGGEGMSREAEEWNLKLQKAVEGHLEKTGATLTATGVSAGDLDANEQYQQTVLQLQQKYDNIEPQMLNHIKNVKKARYTMGDEVALLPCSAGSDALLFVRGMGMAPSTGEKFKSAGLIGLLAMGKAATARITFVDAKSGEVLAYSLMLGNGDKALQDPDKAFGKALDKNFKEMKIGPNANPKKRKK
jgi:hypothetical protein